MRVTRFAAGAVRLHTVLFLLRSAVADFIYRDFNDTSGLRLNGNAATSSCGHGDEYAYSVLQGVNDAVDAGSQPAALGDTAGAFAASKWATFDGDALATTLHLARFPHRDDVAPAPDGAECPVRLRCVHNGGSHIIAFPPYHCLCPFSCSCPIAAD